MLEDAHHTFLVFCHDSLNSVNSAELIFLETSIKLDLYKVDVAGGYSPSMLNAQRTAVHSSNAISFQKQSGYNTLNYKEVFRLATLDGSKGEVK